MDAPPDDEELAQWMTVCDDCDNPVEHYCNTCGDKLCGSCKQQHLSRRKNRNHDVVPYTADVHISTSSTATCDKHPGRQVDLYCKPCQVPVCSQCVAETHGDHKLTSITEAVGIAREQATGNLQRMWTEDRPRMKEEKTTATAIMDRAEEGLNNTEQQMRKTAELLRNEIDAILETYLSRLQEVRARDVLPRAQKQKDMASERLDLLEDEIKSYEDKLRSGNPVTLLTFMKVKLHSSASSFQNIDYHEVPLPEYKPAAINRSILRDQFGFLEPTTAMKVQRKSVDEQRSKSAKQFKEFTDKGSLKPTAAELRKAHLVLRQPILRSDFTIKSNDISELCRLRFSKENKIWIHGFGRRILLTDLNGSVLKSVDAGCDIDWCTGMAVTKSNELLYCDSYGNKVMKMAESKVISTFMAYLRPGLRDVYCLSNGNIIVTNTFENVLKIYTNDGDCFTNVGKEHLSCPYYVNVNKLNQDICVSDAVKQVVVFSSDGHHRFTYRGEDDWKSGFRPRDLCTDQMGNILITDGDNHRVHIVDKDGKFLQYLVTDSDGLQYPCTIDINNNGEVWVGEQLTKKVKVYKYLF